MVAPLHAYDGDKCRVQKYVQGSENLRQSVVYTSLRRAPSKRQAKA
jgi:hypothetical protein